VISVTPRLLLVAAVLAASPSAVLAQHRGLVEVAFSPDGTQFLSSGGDDTVILWDAVQRKSLRTFPVRTRDAIAFLPDGRTVVSGDVRSLRIWDLASGRVTQDINIGENVAALAIAGDGRTVLVGFSYRYPQLWNLASGQPVRSFEAPDSASSYAVAISPDGRQALSTDKDGVATLWDMATGQRLRTFSEYAKTSRTIAFSPDGKTALAGRTLYDLASGKVVRQFDDSDYTSRSIISRDGRLVLTAYNETLKSWEFATGTLLHAFPSQAERRYIRSLAMAPDNSLAVTGTYKGHVTLWDVDNGRVIAAFDSAREAFERVFAVVGMALLALFLWRVAIKTLRKHQIERQTKYWPTVQGRIFSSAVDTNQWMDAFAVLGNLLTPVSRGPRYLPYVCYRYSIAGFTYESERLYFDQKKFWYRAEAEEAIKPYPAGTDVTVHYMPQDPSIAVLSTEETMHEQLYAFFGMAIVATVMIVMFQYVF
jgi:hypothetical protein